MDKGKLYLIPTFIGDGHYNMELPENIKEIIHCIDIFIVENDKTARHFLKPLSVRPIQQLDIRMMDKHGASNTYLDLIKECLNNKNIGVISEAGLPCIADPGAFIVKAAHNNGVEVVPLVGPSSIFLALMGSGLNGQLFSFNGYLPVEKEERAKKIKELEKLSAMTGATQIFIETPYRNNHLFKDLLRTCNGKTMLTVALAILTENQMIKTKAVSAWKNTALELEKYPAIFLINAGQ